MNPDFKKSCKYCFALSMGIVLGMILMNYINNPVIKKEDNNCKCQQ